MKRCLVVKGPLVGSGRVSGGVKICTWKSSVRASFKPKTFFSWPKTGRHRNEEQFLFYFSRPETKKISNHNSVELTSCLQKPSILYHSARYLQPQASCQTYDCGSGRSETRKHGFRQKVTVSAVRQNNHRTKSRPLLRVSYFHRIK